MSEISGTTPADPSSNCYTVVHDWDEDGHLAVTVAEALADCSGVPTDELPALYDVVDTDALDAILRPGETERPATAGRPVTAGQHDSVRPSGAQLVSFAVPELDYAVTIHADGRVEVTERA